MNPRARPGIQLVHLYNVSNSCYFRATFYFSGNRRIFRTNSRSFHSDSWFQQDTAIPVTSHHDVIRYGTVWFHLINVLLHCGATALLYRICKHHIFTSSKKPSFSSDDVSGNNDQILQLPTNLTVILFALHPIHTEAVSQGGK